MVLEFNFNKNIIACMSSTYFANVSVKTFTIISVKLQRYLTKRL